MSRDYKKYYQENKERIKKRVKERKDRIRDNWKVLCEECGLLKPRHNSKICVSCYSKKYRQKNRTKYQERDKRYASKEENKLKILTRRWARSNKPITENSKCEVCGSKSELSHHHLEYTFSPKDVLILCKKCHDAIENLKRKPDSQERKKPCPNWTQHAVCDDCDGSSENCMLPEKESDE